ncbi:hypothetical protein CVT24_002091 [Panaeolus cyanescens]|uniref:STAS domain-containing protein n=1 Tax=Panaeolus cyanescens TaxID=181874 RepID=A0A409YIA1_9AGAR|nr:hypothetical protein CVT24_002091 [Panaeolus cyanescens]
MAERIKNFAKRAVDHPDNTVPIISSTAWTHGVFNNPVRKIQDYLISLFPIATWITRYNVGWLSGDLIAGLTVVPQGMSYAVIATLPAEYGLYLSFVGVLIYCFFTTSKDVSIGPVAVMSLTVSQVIKHVEASHPGEWSRPQIPTVLALITGFIVLGIVGSCLGAYPATGSFSRSALKSKSGVCTPLAGVVTAIVVVVALYGLTDAFFWIPNAGLSAIIIHAVADLIYSYWRVSPLEFIIWLAAVVVTLFSSIENEIYTSIAASLVLLLLRVAKPRGTFLGKAHVRIAGSDEFKSSSREVFLTLSKTGIPNFEIEVLPPSPGVLVYRFEESYLYPNCSILNSVLVDYVKENMQRGRDMTNVKLSDRPWNDPGPRGTAAEDEIENRKKPILHAIVLDFSTVSHIDTTAIQALIDARHEIEKWADHLVEH